MAKTLKFNEQNIPAILAGDITVTWRLQDEKDLMVNDQIECLNARTGLAFGRARIEEVSIKRLSDVESGIDNGDVEVGDIDALYERLRKFYGESVGPESVVKLVRFSFAPYEKPREPKERPIIPKVVKLFADGGSRGNPGPSASGYVLLDENDQVLVEKGVYLGLTTNNQAEYQALKFGLEEAHRLGAREVHVFLDSLLVVNQMLGKFKVRNRDLWPIHQAIKDLLPNFSKVTFQHVPREMNKLADHMVNETLDAETV